MPLQREAVFSQPPRPSLPRTDPAGIIGMLRRGGPEGRVPAIAGDALGGKEVDVLAVPATVVKQRRGGDDEPVVQRGFHGPRQIAAADGGLVTGDGGML